MQDRACWRKTFRASASPADQRSTAAAMFPTRVRPGSCPLTSLQPGKNPRASIAGKHLLFLQAVGQVGTLTQEPEEFSRNRQLERLRPHDVIAEPVKHPEGAFDQAVFSRQDRPRPASPCRGASSDCGWLASICSV